MEPRDNRSLLVLTGARMPLSHARELIIEIASVSLTVTYSIFLNICLASLEVNAFSSIIKQEGSVEIDANDV